MDLGRVGIWTNTLDAQPVSLAQEAAAELEELGFGAIWYPESVQREAMANAALLLSGTRRIVVASGIANIYARDALTMMNGARTLHDAFPDRFLCGIGVSHRPNVEGVRGHNYGPPLATMRSYLDAMAAAPFAGHAAATEAPLALAALGPKMLALSAQRTRGAHPYFVPPEHTAVARAALGPDAWLMPEQTVILETDPSAARQLARNFTERYLALENYTNNLRRLGFGDEDLAGAGSDRLVDAVVAWGSIDQVAARVRAHLDAGADHVCIQALEADPRALPQRSWRALAAALL